MNFSLVHSPTNLELANDALDIRLKLDRTETTLDEFRAFCPNFMHVQVRELAPSLQKMYDIANYHDPAIEEPYEDFDTLMKSILEADSPFQNIEYMNIEYAYDHVPTDATPQYDTDENIVSMTNPQKCAILSSIGENELVSPSVLFLNSTNPASDIDLAQLTLPPAAVVTHSYIDSVPDKEKLDKQCVDDKNAVDDPDAVLVAGYYEYIFMHNSLSEAYRRGVLMSGDTKEEKVIVNNINTYPRLLDILRLLEPNGTFVGTTFNHRMALGGPLCPYPNPNFQLLSLDAFFMNFALFGKLYSCRISEVYVLEEFLYKHFYDAQFTFGSDVDHFYRTIDNMFHNELSLNILILKVKNGNHLPRKFSFPPSTGVKFPKKKSRSYYTSDFTVPYCTFLGQDNLSVLSVSGPNFYFEHFEGEKMFFKTFSGFIHFWRSFECFSYPLPPHEYDEVKFEGLCQIEDKKIYFYKLLAIDDNEVTFGYGVTIAYSDSFRSTIGKYFYYREMFLDVPYRKPLRSKFNVEVVNYCCAPCHRRVTTLPGEEGYGNHFWYSDDPRVYLHSDLFEDSNSGLKIAYRGGRSFILDYVKHRLRGNEVYEFEYNSGKFVCVRNDKVNSTTIGDAYCMNQGFLTRCQINSVMHFNEKIYLGNLGSVEKLFSKTFGKDFVKWDNLDMQLLLDSYPLPLFGFNPKYRNLIEIFRYRLFLHTKYFFGRALLRRDYVNPYNSISSLDLHKYYDVTAGTWSNCDPSFRSRARREFDYADKRDKIKINP